MKLAIIKIIEDSRNVEEDTSMADGPVILLVEDSRRFYSLFLPQLYQELMEQTGSLAGEGLSLHHKVLRRRARAKILLATDMEQAQYFYKQYSKHIIGLITDAGYPWKGEHNSNQGDSSQNYEQLIETSSFGENDYDYISKIAFVSSSFE